MSVIVSDSGFGRDDGQDFVDIPSDFDRAGLGRFLNAPALVIEFPSFADGRGFGLARALRSLGYKGRLRARGHVISDQYLNARLSGFDEVEISEDLAKRQPEAHWLRRGSRLGSNYQARLQGAA